MLDIITDIIKYIFISLSVILIGYSCYYFFIRHKADLIQSLHIPLTVYLFFAAVERPDSRQYSLNNIQIEETHYNLFAPMKYSVKYTLLFDKKNEIRELILASKKDAEKILRAKLAVDENFITIMSLLTDKRTKETGVEKLAQVIIEYDFNEMEITEK